MAGLLFGQLNVSKDAPVPVIPPPPSFADFRFTTIGREPELLKRISAPEPDSQYTDDSSSPALSLSVDLRHPSQTPEPSRSHLRPSLFQTLAGPNGSADAAAAVDEMAIDNLSPQQPQVPLGLTKDPQRATEIGHPPDTTNNEANMALELSALSPSHVNRNQPSTSTHLRPPVPTYFPSSVLFSSHSSASTRVSGVTEETTGIRPKASEGESRYSSLRSLQSRLMYSLANLNPPDIANALLLVQAADTQSSNALSKARHSHTVAQQALSSAREAVIAAQECLSAAEQAKLYVSDAIAAVERAGVSDLNGHKTVLVGLQDDLRMLGEWVDEREEEEAARRREMEKAEKHKELSDSVLQMTDEGGLSPRAVQALAAEVAQKAAEKEALFRSRSVQETQTLPLAMAIERDLQRFAEMEADDVTKAWSSVKPNSTIAAQKEQEIPEPSEHGSRRPLQHSQKRQAGSQQGERTAGALYLSMAAESSEAITDARSEGARVMTVPQEREHSLPKQQETAMAQTIEAGETELHETQSKMRQEVMDQKRRASAEMAAKIRSQRAREMGSTSTSHSSKSPVSPTFSTHPLPSPVNQIMPLASPRQPVNQVARQTLSPLNRAGPIPGVVQTGRADKPSHASPPKLTCSTDFRSKTSMPSPLQKPSNSQSTSAGAINSHTSPRTKPSAAPVRKPEALISSQSKPVIRSQNPGSERVRPPKQSPISPEAQTANLRPSKEENDVKPISIKQEGRDSPLLVGGKRKVKEEAGSISSKKLKVRSTTEEDKLVKKPESPALPSTPAIASSLYVPSPSSPNDINLSTTARSPVVTSNAPVNHSGLNGRPSQTPTEVSQRPTGSSKPTPNTQLTSPAAAIRKTPTEPSALSKNVPPSTNNIRSRPLLERAYISDYAPIPNPHLDAAAGLRSSIQPPLGTPTLNSYNMSHQHQTVGSNSYRAVSPKSHSGESSHTAPAIQGRRDQSMQGGEDSSNTGRGRDLDYSARNDHYSPPAKTSPLGAYSRRPPLLDHRVVNAPYSAPLAVAEPRTPSWPPLRSPILEKARHHDNDRLAESPGHRHWQGESERGRGGLSSEPYPARTPARSARRSPSPERHGALQSRIGIRDPDTRYIAGSQSYRPPQSSDSYPTQPRWAPSSYLPTAEPSYTPRKQDHPSTRAPSPGSDRYTFLGGHQVSETPDLLDRMSARALARGRATPFRGPSRARGGRGGARPHLEQRISKNTLMNRLESPPRLN